MTDVLLKGLKIAGKVLLIWCVGFLGLLIGLLFIYLVNNYIHVIFFIFIPLIFGFILVGDKLFKLFPEILE